MAFSRLAIAARQLHAPIRCSNLLVASTRKQSAWNTTRFASSLATEPQASLPHAIRLRAPKKEDLGDDGDPEVLVKEEEAMIDITTRAAEVYLPPTWPL